MRYSAKASSREAFTQCSVLTVVAMVLCVLGVGRSLTLFQRLELKAELVSVS